MATSTATRPPAARPTGAGGDGDERPRDDAHRAARMHIYELVRSCQLEGGLTCEMVAALVTDAEQRGWPDVVKLAMFLGSFCARYIDRDADSAEWIEMLLTRARADSDDVMTALALSARAQDLTITETRAPVDGDRDLARATVLLEGETGRSSEAVSAHIECAYACEARDLWELQLLHYEAAERCLDWGEDGPGRLAVVLYNRAETEVTWVAALRERGGDCPELAERAACARRALEAAELDTMPDEWREDLHIFRELIDAMSPPPGGAAPLTRPAEGRYEGLIHLTRALSATDPAEGSRHCARAIETIDPIATSRIHLFALGFAVELEAARAGGESAALRWGRELIERKWERRLASLATVQSLVGIERREAEHALLAQHAYLDDLTGLANRRAMHRFIDGLADRGVNHVAVALIDVDRFKLVNDGHGHAVGDEVLARVAGILRSGVREHNLVARLGGDEFLIVLTMQDLEAARRRCATLSASINGQPWGELSDGLAVTASFGLAVGAAADFAQLSTTADEALYRAKQAGGGRVCV